MRAPAVLLLAVFAAAEARAADFACPAQPSGDAGQVTAVLAPIEARRTVALQQVEALPAGAQDARLERLGADYRRDRALALAPLAAGGNARAMVGLASALRDSREPADVRRWLALASCAARLGDNQARDELVRWRWHQRGDGSLGAVQANRAAALDYAEQAAAAGAMAPLSRIATYIAGDVHQYPANPALAARLRALVVRAPDGWPALAPAWREIRREILAQGATSVGAETACTTATPWCLGALAGTP